MTLVTLVTLVTGIRMSIRVFIIHTAGLGDCTTLFLLSSPSLIPINTLSINQLSNQFM
jgi:hypothetical protein